MSIIEMTRKIRDEHAKRLAGKSYSERIAFYRERAKKMEKKLPALLSELSTLSSGKENYPKDRHEQLDDQNMSNAIKRIREKHSTYKKRRIYSEMRRFYLRIVVFPCD